MKRVTIYTTPTCPHCRTAKDYLTAQDIDFDEKDISKDIYARDEMVNDPSQPSYFGYGMCLSF